MLRFTAHLWRGVGLVGQQGVGKTSLFAALMGEEGGASAVPDAHGVRSGTTKITDKRQVALAAFAHQDSPSGPPPRVIEAGVRILDVPGIVPRTDSLVDRAGGAAADSAPDESKQNSASISALRSCDGLLHVVRLFRRTDAASSSVDDVGAVDRELIRDDLSRLWKRMGKLEKTRPKKDPELQLLALLEKWMLSGRPVRDLMVPGAESGLDGSIVGQCKSLLSTVSEGMRRENPSMVDGGDASYLASLWLLSSKPQLFALNIDEAFAAPALAATDTLAAQVEEALGASRCCRIAASFEEQLAHLPADDRAPFMAEYGLEKLQRDLLVPRLQSDLLREQVFFTVGPETCRAWAVRAGATASQAAAAIHSDFERYFLRAHVASAEHYMTFPSMAVAERRAFTVVSGRHVLQDGDVMVVDHSARSKGLCELNEHVQMNERLIIVLQQRFREASELRDAEQIAVRVQECERSLHMFRQLAADAAKRRFTEAQPRLNLHKMGFLQMAKLNTTQLVKEYWNTYILRRW